MWANAQRDGSPCRMYVAPSVQRRKVWLTPTTRVPCSNAAKTRNQLKFAGVPQTRQQISVLSRPKFTILWGHVEEISLFKKFFRLSIHASAAKIQPDKVVRWCQTAIFCVLYFSVPHAAHFRDVHSKFALGPHHVYKYGRHPICDDRLGEEKR